MDRRAGGPLHRRPRKFLEGLREQLIAGLIAYARHAMRLAARQPDGTRLRDHLEALERHSGRRHPLLDGPPLPAAGAHLWRWFVALRAGLSDGPLTYSESRAWAALAGERPHPWEVAALRALDAACRAAWEEQHGR